MHTPANAYVHVVLVLGALKLETPELATRYKFQLATCINYSCKKL